MKDGSAMTRGLGLLQAERGTLISVTAAVLVLGLLVAGVVCYVTPRIYQARSVFEPLTTPGVTVGATDPETVAAILTSKECLLEVCDKLDLDQQWKLDHESACRALRECVTVAVQPNGRLVEVTVRLAQPTIARDIAAELPRSWGRRALKLAEQQYTDTIVRAENGAGNQDWLAGETAAALAQVKGRVPRDPPELAKLENRLQRETGLAAAMRREAQRLTAVRDTLVIPLVVHENPALPHLAVSPDVPAFFARWLGGSLLVGLLLALPAAALYHRLKDRRGPSEDARVPATAAEAGW